MRKIIVTIIAIAVWGVAIAYFISWRAEERRYAEEHTLPPSPLPPPPVFGPGEGEFETFFKERHPLSTNKAEILRRLRFRPEQLRPTTGPAADANDDYDLTKKIFRMYVPKNYDASTPHGIIYYLGYKDTTAVPPEWKPKLEQMHLIFVAPRAVATPDWQRAAIALDAVFGLKKQYNIDERRIYLFGFPNSPGLIGLQMALGLPEEFSGFVNIETLGFYRPVPVPRTNTAYLARLLPPPPEQLALSKTKPHVLIVTNEYFRKPNLPDQPDLFENAYKQNGFARVLFISIADKEDLHFPNMKGPWFEQTIAFLDGAKPATAP